MLATETVLKQAELIAEEITKIFTESFVNKLFWLRIHTLEHYIWIFICAP